ncbi:MAG: CDP-alcohol phosphatidyltransferase family protein [Elusimicrobia bacterium]|nr:CDP-alcohol phosphatidyltransferase family protein [Elusimicrobiota bacterium]
MPSPQKPALLFLEAVPKKAQSLAGLPWLERILFQSSRAAIPELIVTGEAPELRRHQKSNLRCPSGLRLHWISSENPNAPSQILYLLGKEFWLLCSQTLIRPAWMQALPTPATAPLLQILTPSSVPAAAYLRLKSPTPFAQAWKAAKGNFSALMRLLPSYLTTQKISAPAQAIFRLRLESETGAAQRWLFQTLIKENEGFMSRHLERKISFQITQQLLKTSLRPNQVTWGSILLGATGGLLLATGTFGWSLGGALLFWIHSIVDGCDGELARLKYLETPQGGALDFWGDNVVHAAVFAGTGIGLFRQTQQMTFLLLSASASLFVILTAHWVFRKEGPQFTGIHCASKLQDRLAQRDFIYVFLLLAALGRLPWFLWAAAIGTPCFYFLLRVPAPWKFAMLKGCRKSFSLFF